jgi:hypothetical protein
MGLADEAREHVSDFGISQLNPTRYSPRMTIPSDLDAFTREHDGCRPVQRRDPQVVEQMEGKGYESYPPPLTTSATYSTPLRRQVTIKTRRC